MATGRPCTVCNHPQRDAIDRALLASGTAVKPVSMNFGVTQQALTRHRDNHMPRAAREEGAQAVAEAEGTRGAALLRDACSLRARAMRLLEQAEAMQDVRAANGSLREARECLKLEALLMGELDEAPVINLLVAPVFVQVQAMILAALAPYPDAKLAVVRALENVR
jgi:hypothetical protein